MGTALQQAFGVSRSINGDLKFIMDSKPKLAGSAVNLLVFIISVSFV